MNKGGLNDFLVGVIHNEEVSSVLAITKNDLSAFAKLCEDSLKKLSIMNLARGSANTAMMMPKKVIEIIDSLIAPHPARFA